MTPPAAAECDPLRICFWRLHVESNTLCAAYKGNTSCARVPRARQLRVSAREPLWQEVGQVEHTHVYAAHWDARVLPTVRVLLYTGLAQLPPLYCQFWYEALNGQLVLPLRFHEELERG